MSHICGVINLVKKENKIDIFDWMRAGVVFLLMLPFLIIGAILIVIYTFIDKRDLNKCEHWKECPWYNDKSVTCNEDFGMAYGYNRYGGCFESVKKRKEELKEQGKALRRLR